MRHYLSHAKEFPPPEGLEPPKPAEIVSAKTGEYQILCTFLPDVTPRSMAIRGPDGVHFAYDLQACRLAYAWTAIFSEHYACLGRPRRSAGADQGPCVLAFSSRLSLGPDRFPE